MNSISTCVKPVDSCHVFNTTNQATCFGAKIPYSATSFQLSPNTTNSFKETAKLLRQYANLKASPRCWEVVQPFLCSVFLPKCEENKINLPPSTLCNLAKDSCQSVYNMGWPQYLHCSNDRIFQDKCEPKKEDKIKFNTSNCIYPLIKTSYEDSYYDAIEGCSMKCNTAYFSDRDHVDVHNFVSVLLGMSLICTLFALFSFAVDWRNSGKYPARVVFYINICFFVSNVGWCLQFIPGARRLMTCRSDHTTRIHEPSGAQGSTLCLFVFILVYFFQMSAITWYTVLNYLWSLMYTTSTKGKNPLHGKAQKFHMLAWVVPFALTVACLGFSTIDGDPISGICYVSTHNNVFRGIFLLLPVSIATCVSGYYVMRALKSLRHVRSFHHESLSKKSIKKVTIVMLRLGIFSILSLLCVCIAFGAEIYSITHQHIWKKSHKDYYQCMVNNEVMRDLYGEPPNKCTQTHKPSTAVKKLSISSLFMATVVMSAWVWTRASLLNWRRFVYRITGKSDNETKRIREPSKLIAKAFRDRNMLNNALDNRNDGGLGGMEGLMFSEHTISHQDPVDMNFVLNSVSTELSPKWYKHVPKFIRRRGGITMDPNYHGNIVDHPHGRHESKKKDLMQWAMPHNIHSGYHGNEKKKKLGLADHVRKENPIRMSKVADAHYPQEFVVADDTGATKNINFLNHNCIDASKVQQPIKKEIENKATNPNTASTSIGPQSNLQGESSFMQQADQMAQIQHLYNQQVSNHMIIMYQQALLNQMAGFQMPVAHQDFPPPQQPQQLPPHITIDNLPPHYHLLTSPTCLPRPDDNVVMPTSSMEGSLATVEESEADVSLSRFGVDLESRASDVSGMPQEEFLR